ncbi:MAG TPA: magnesium/cobalt transporter CorA [Flavobacteriaceae bacterium]|nr:magnesium/cobalt transporter CorA [Flavobacteriaceae bacterium]
MTRFIKKKKEEIGQSPDELFFRGKKKMDQVVVRIIDFDAENLTEDLVASVKEISKYKEEDTVTWLNIDGLHNLKLMEEIATVFDFDSLVMAEVMNTEARPKIIDYDNCTLITIKMLQQDPKTETIMVENLSLILTKTVLITFQERKGDVFEPVRERIRKQKKRIKNGGTDYLTFALLDIVVDNYLYVISLLGEKIETLEENLLLDPDQDVIIEINNYKRELNFLRKNIKPAKEMIFSLAKMESELISDSTYVHFKELQDNISQASDSSDSYREILSDQLNIYHTTISSKLNDIMRFLTVFSVIFIPLTFIAGIYGTNFDHIPELHYKYSYFIMWGIMIVIVIGMLLYFRKKKWL